MGSRLKAQAFLSVTPRWNLLLSAFKKKQNQNKNLAWDPQSPEFAFPSPASCSSPPLLSFPFLPVSLLHPFLLPSVSLSFLLPPLIPSSSLQPSEVCSFHPPFLSPPPFPVTFVFLPLPMSAKMALQTLLQSLENQTLLCSLFPFLFAPLPMQKAQEEMKTDQSKEINLLLLLLLLSEKYPRVPFLDNTARALLMTFVARGDCGFWPANFLLSNTLAVFRV